ncbi:MAG TPA: hypothetical protein VGQ04_05270 [Chitinophagaceae bacterium]|jgi:hypothetical protein|nr:hypothetical protein [Chitinophagaceae bacterium]
MKKITTPLFFVILSTILFAQNVKKIENLKDGWDVSVNYTGEIKDGKPNGMGVATYKTGNAIRYVGRFVNGMYDGKGTMFFKDGELLSGDWRTGKLNGKGSFLSESGVLYIGDFVNGIKEGKGILFFKDNGMIMGSFSSDKLNGRGFQIFADGSILSDVSYTDDKRNGTGYQYEIKTKQLYEGEWRDDKWVQSGPASFTSFLKSPSLIAEATADHISAELAIKNNIPIDSVYYFDLKKHERYFFYYSSGQLRSGVVIGDSTRFWGHINEKGASGYCYGFEYNKSYSEGNYMNDLLNGLHILHVDLSKQTAYYGGAVNGEFTGKAYFFNNQGTMFVGDYVKGRINGNGYKFEANGRLTVGIWENGVVKKLTSITTPSGEVISGTPKNFAEGLNTAIKSYPDVFDNIYGDVVLEDDILTEMEEIDKDDVLTFTYSLVNIPGSLGKNLIAEDFDENTFYYSKFLRTKDAAKAKAKYNELATQLQSAVISNSFFTGKQKLTGKVIPPDTSKDKTESEFTISRNSSDFEDFKVWLRLRKVDDEFIVEILLGEKAEDF